MLNVLLWVLALWFGIWGLVLLPFHFADLFWSMQNQIVTDAGLITALVLLRRGRFRASSFIYLGSIWFFATHVMALNGGIRSNVQALYVTLPVSAAWLLGYEAAFWTLGFCMSCTLVFAVLELAGAMLPRRIPGTPFGAWAVFGMACLIGALPVAQILRDLRLALIRSREAEENSQSAMERLSCEIEEHKRTEQALRESEERFRITADTAPVMILARDASQNANFFNKVWLDFRGRTVQQEMGTGWMEGVHPDDFERHLGELAAASADRQTYQLQFRMRRADGQYRLLLCHGVPRFELDRTFNGYLVSLIDITDLKRSQEEALARHKLESLGVLAAGIAHDFNNLLGSISAESELLIEELQNSAVRESVSRIQSVALHAAEIVRQLMVYAGQESGSVANVDLAAVIHEMVSLMDVSISKNAHLEIHLEDGLPFIQADVTQIRQVLLNLITNASEALGGHPGIITVRLTQLHPQDAFEDEPRSGRYLRLEVADTGCGISDRIRAAIFDPFFTTKGAGRGLGLALVQGIVRGHGGQMSVESSPGRGSCFQILFPCAPAPLEAPKRHELRPAAGSASTTVLMIEDEAVLRGAVAEVLRARGLRVLEAGDGAAALQLCRTHGRDIDVAVLDVTLPGLSSSQVLQHLREKLPEAKVVITSAYGREDAVALVNAERNHPYIRKPYRVSDLLDLIQNTMS